MLFSCVKIVEKVKSHVAVVSSNSYASPLVSNLLHGAITLQMRTNLKPIILVIIIIVSPLI